MALLVDPPSRDSADERPPAGVPSSAAAAEEADAVPDSPVITEPLLAPEPTDVLNATANVGRTAPAAVSGSAPSVPSSG